MFSILRTIWLTFLHIFPQNGNDRISGGKALFASKVPGQNCVDTVMPIINERCVACNLCAAVLSCRLHLATGHRE